MGGNEIVLVDGEKFPREPELSVGLKVLNGPGIGGDQLGLLFAGDGSADLSTKIIDRHSAGYIPVCGGLTQVLGAAEAELGLTEVFGFGSPERDGEVALETELGLFPILIGKGRVVSEMDRYLDSLKCDGVKAGRVMGVKSYRVGAFFVTFVRAIRQKFPEASFDPLDGSTKELLSELQEKFREEFSLESENRDFALVGEARNPDRDGKLLFPHDPSRGLVEPACGTGSIAAAVAMHKEGLLEDKRVLKLSFESGGDHLSLGGPEVTEVELELQSGDICSARFSHSLVEVLATGKLYPGVPGPPAADTRPRVV